MSDVKKPGEFDGKPDVESVLPPPKPFLTSDQLAEIWDTRGMKYRVDEIHVALMNRGLLPSVDRPAFRQLMHDFLESFLVKGEARRDPRRSPRQRLPRYV
jgi:hypothetical protein